MNKKERVSCIAVGHTQQQELIKFEYKGVRAEQRKGENEYKRETDSLRAINNFLLDYDNNKVKADDKEQQHLILEVKLKLAFETLEDNRALAWAYYKAKGNQQQLKKLKLIVNYCDSNNIKYADLLNKVDTNELTKVFNNVYVSSNAFGYDTAISIYKELDKIN